MIDGIVTTGVGKIFLRGILQLNTYRNFLEGNFSERMNDLMLKHHRVEVDRLWPDLPKVTLGVDELRKSRKAMRWPDVMCAGLFMAYEPAQNCEQDGSTLVLIWFQDEISPVVSSENLTRIANVDWKAYAQDFSW